MLSTALIAPLLSATLCQGIAVLGSLDESAALKPTEVSADAEKKPEADAAAKAEAALAEAEAEKKGTAGSQTVRIDPGEYAKANPAKSGQPTLVLSEDAVNLGIPAIRDMEFKLPEAGEEVAAGGDEAALPAVEPEGIASADSSEAAPTADASAATSKDASATPAADGSAAAEAGSSASGAPAAETETAVASSLSAPDEDALSLDMVLFGKEAGDLARLDCRDATGKGDVYAYGSQVAFARAVTDKAERNGALAPVFMNVGDTVFPGSFANYLFSKGDAGMDQLAGILGGVPYDLMSLGNHDLSPKPEETKAYLMAARRAGLPLMAANLKCKDRANVLCQLGSAASSDGGTPYRIIQRGPVKIGLTAVIDPSVAAQVAKDRLEGVEILQPKPVLKKIVSTLRKDEGVDLVFVILHQGTSKATVELEEMQDGVDGMDLLVTDKLFSGDAAEAFADGRASFSRMGHMVLPLTHTYMLGAGVSESSATLVTLKVVKEQGRYRLDGADPRSIVTGGLFPADQGTVDAVKAASADFCGAWGTPLNGQAKMSPEFAYEDMSLFILNALRFTAKAEVSFMNRAAFRNPERFPLSGTLSKADVLSTLPFGSRLMEAEIKGEDLARLCAATKDGSVVAAGVASDGKGGWLINGRPLDKKRLYTIVLNEFIAEGSGGFLDPKALKGAHPWRDPENGGVEPQLSTIVMDAVSQGRFAKDNGDGTFSLSPDKSFPDLHLNMLWQVGGHLNASYSHMSITNPGRTADYDGDYDKSRLTATPTDHLNVDFKLMANGATRNHGWDNDFIIQYATTREKGPGESGEFEEDKDIARLRSAYKYLGQRADWGDAWYVPVPFVEGQVETEMTKEEESANHPLELTGIVGLLLKLHRNLEYKVGFNVRGDVLEKDGHPSVGLFTGYRLMKTDLFDIGTHPVQFESEAEYFYNAEGGDRLHEFRWDNRLFFNITGNLSFTASFNMYIYKTKMVGETGKALEGMVGLNVAYERMIQNF